MDAIEQEVSPEISAPVEQPKQKTHNIAELNEHYRKGDECDAELFAEMRSNILLESGNHYSKRSSTSFFNNIRNSQKLSDNQKLRLTKNHVQKITKTYKNSIMEYMPGVTIAPHNELEPQDKKAAEINQAVWKDMQDRYDLRSHKRDGVSNFVTIGERVSFLYYEPNYGAVKGYNQLLGPDGVPQFDQAGQPVPDMTQPVFEGGLCFKQVPAYNLLRHPGAKTMKQSAYHIIREMVPVKELEDAYEGDTKKLSYIKGSGDEQFVVFDVNKKSYEPSKEEILLRYHFFKPCRQYPQGYYYICVKGGILEEGELPYGLYPIVWRGFDKFPDSPRGVSIIKVIRPYQAEINRASSQMAMHQITVGDDKIIYQGGTKLAPGALLPGVRGITYQGIAPQILPGRDGSQFMPYIDAQIREMYAAAMLDEIIADKPSAQADPYTLLFQTASQQKAFKQYVVETEEFEKELSMLALEFAKKYYDDDMVIKIAGKSEAVNLSEFRNTQPNSFIIKAEPQSEAIDSRMGKQLALNHVLQYVGPQMGAKQIGLVLKEMPFLNNQTLFKYLTSDYDNVENDMLAIERGQMPDISPYADNELYVNALTGRMKKPDFKLLAPPIQDIYNQVLVAHETQIAQKAKAKQAAADGFIPTGGALITCSMQMPDPDSKDGNGTKQVRIPYEALIDLIEKLENQGSSLESLQSLNSGAVNDIVTQGGLGQQQPLPQQEQQPF